jgi:hypothetical protein
MIAAEAIVDRKYLIAPSPNLSFVGLEPLTNLKGSAEGRQRMLLGDVPGK